MTGKYGGSAQSKCNINVKQSQSNFISVILHNFRNYDCDLFFKTLVDKKKDKVNFKIILKAIEEYIPISYGCITFVDSYRLLSSSLDKLVEPLADNSQKSLKNLKKDIVDDNNMINIVNEIEKILKLRKQLKI